LVIVGGGLAVLQVPMFDGLLSALDLAMRLGMALVANVLFGSWVCGNVGRTREMPFRLDCRNFGVNEINGLEGQRLQASGRFSQITESDGVFTQPRS
jgi:hypothetical protein